MDGLCDITSGQCILGCKDGYFNSSGQCSKCPENCLNCTSTTSCTYCDTGKYGHACESACDKCKDGICDIDTGACTNGCVDPYYINANSECDQCRWTCASCTSHDSCDQCTSHEFWGPNCLYYCANCLAGCDKNDGCTYGCDVGYFKHYNDTMDGYQCHTCPDRCSECTDYDYGNCSKCSRNSWGLTCEYSCIGCKDDLCSRNEGCVNGCSKGYFPRGNHSAGSLCEGCLVGCEACSNDHSCLGCKPGLFGDRCQHLCSENDSKCIECELETLTCSKCQDGFFPGRNACEPCSKNCVEGSQPYCSPDSGVCIHGCDSNSFWGLACEYDCTGCGYDVCDRTSGCLRGCLNGYFLTKTENIYTEYHCEPCASNCETCHNASSCISCDIRFYGESCESPCNSGLDKCIRCAGYGTDDFRCLECEEWYFPSVGACKPCSVHCLGGHWPSCTQSSGVCVRGCKEGWQGKRCDRAICMVENCNTCVFDNSSMCVECQFGFYGDTNAQVCTRCPDTCASGTTCNRESGSCDYGCRDGLSGSRCDQKCNSRCAQCAQYNKDFCNTCKLWFYGNICEHSCSVNCKELGDEQICDKSTGRCLHGCKDAFSGSNCSISCNEGCKGQLCDGISGQCLNGCERGHWGITCSATCSAGCRDQDCNSTIGFCQAGCKDGFEGAFCEASE